MFILLYSVSETIYSICRFKKRKNWSLVYLPICPNQCVSLKDLPHGGLSQSESSSMIDEWMNAPPLLLHIQMWLTDYLRTLDGLQTHLIDRNQTTCEAIGPRMHSAGSILFRCFSTFIFIQIWLSLSIDSACH